MLWLFFFFFPRVYGEVVECLVGGQHICLRSAMLAFGRHLSKEKTNVSVHIQPEDFASFLFHVSFPCWTLVGHCCTTRFPRSFHIQPSVQTPASQPSFKSRQLVVKDLLWSQLDVASLDPDSMLTCCDPDVNVSLEGNQRLSIGCNIEQHQRCGNDTPSFCTHKLC